MPDEGPIKAWFDKDDQARQESLDRARLWASLSKPAVLPPRDHDSNRKLPEPFQSDGSYGVQTLKGKMVAATFPLSHPWVKLQLPGHVEMRLAQSEEGTEILSRTYALLDLTERIMVSALESSTGEGDRRRRPWGFRAAKHQTFDQILVTGDTLEQLTEDFRLKVFRRDQYVTKRDSACDVLYHIVREQIDPLSLSEEQIAAIGLSVNELRDETPRDRLLDIYTLVEWNPLSRRWVITQEANKRVVPNSSGEESTEETVKSYFSTYYDLAPGDDYGRGLIETLGGSLRTKNTLVMRSLEILGLAAKQTPCIDHGSPTRPDDLAKESGVPIRARVVGGRVEDIAMLSYQQIPEYQMISDGIERLTKELARAMLVESALQPHKDRVTATQIQRIALELDGATGGMYAHIADLQQIPLAERTLFQLRKQNKVPPLPEDMVEIEIVSGLAALQRDEDANKLLELMQLAFQTPEMAKRINQAELLERYMRARSMFEPGLIRSDEEIEAEERRQAQIQTEQGVSQVAAQTIGNIVEAQATGS